MTGIRLPSGRPVICLITDRLLAEPRDLAEIVSAAVDGGVNLVQLREKDLPTRELIDLAARLIDAIAGRAPLLVNGRPDVAFATKADGVHLPADGLLPQDARKVLGVDCIVGQSIHSPEEALHYRNAGLDYVELGSIFPSGSHPGRPALGLYAIRAAALHGIPILAVGGVTSRNVANVIADGAMGVAVISSITAEPDPRSAAEQLCANAAEAWEQLPSIA
ncbi:MAG: thiamine phosphate synthase [Chloroflexi bacterium]|nr:thiamine phosphate synthase [Chloroflexota bacterium]